MYNIPVITVSGVYAFNPHVFNILTNHFRAVDLKYFKFFYAAFLIGYTPAFIASALFL